jgi:hypothetical protein
MYFLVILVTDADHTSKVCMGFSSRKEVQVITGTLHQMRSPSTTTHVCTFPATWVLNYLGASIGGITIAASIYMIQCDDTSSMLNLMPLNPLQST